MPSFEIQADSFESIFTERQVKISTGILKKTPNNLYTVLSNSKVSPMG